MVHVYIPSIWETAAGRSEAHLKKTTGQDEIKQRNEILKGEEIRRKCKQK